jgi:hypothetical protein
MAMGVGQAALKEVVVDVHIGASRFRYLSFQSITLCWRKRIENN